MRLIRPLTLALLMAGPAAAQALPPISQNAYIMERLLAAQVGDLIRKNCPQIEGRDVYALYEAYKLRNYALSLGYSSDQVQAFIKSKAEKKRMKSRARDYMTAKGVVEGDQQSYCTLGRDEIARNTITGTLLRAK